MMIKMPNDYRGNPGGNLNTLPDDGFVYGMFDGKYIGFVQRTENGFLAWPDFGNNPDPERFTWFRLPYPHDVNCDEYPEKLHGMQYKSLVYDFNDEVK